MWIKVIPNCIMHCFSFDIFHLIAVKNSGFTHRELSSLPSECLLATAPNPLHLSLVHSASEAASLVRSIPSLTTHHMDRRKTHRRPSQQHLSQLPWSHWSVWLSLQTNHPCVTAHSFWLSVHRMDPGWAQGSKPGSGPSPGVHSRVRAGKTKKGDESLEIH